MNKRNTLRIITNISRMNIKYHRDINIEYIFWPKNNNCIVNTLRFAWKHRYYDYIIYNGSGRNLLYICLLSIIYPWHRIKIISLDLLLPVPNFIIDKIKCMIRRILLSRVHLFILYYKDTKGIEYYYKIPSYKYRYIPFKINQYSEVMNARINDGGYVFCGGKTRRDFETLINSVRGLSIPVKIVTMDNKNIAQHGSYLEEKNIPKNVDIIRLDGSFEPFLKLMAASRIVVLPLKRHICGTGIGVYIMAMALKKCVIISDIVSVTGVIDDGKAIIVSPSDTMELRREIEKAYYDAEYRKKYEERGYKYAISLGGEERLYESIIDVTLNDYLEEVVTNVKKNES